MNMKLPKIIPAVVIVILLGLLIGAVVYINDLKTENKRLKQELNQCKTEYDTRLKNERFDMLCNTAWMWRRSLRYEYAIESYKDALKLKPNVCTIYYDMSLIYDEHLDQPEKAIECYQRYLELIPADAPDREKVKLWLENCRKRIEDPGKGGLYK